MQHIKRTATLAISAGLLVASFGTVATQDNAALPTYEIIHVTGEMCSSPEEWRGPEGTMTGDVAAGFQFENAITWGVGLEFSDPRLRDKLHIVQNGVRGPSS